MVTWCCLGFSFELVPTSIILSEVCQQARLLYTVFDTGTIDGLRVQSIDGCFFELVFQCTVAQVLPGLRGKIYKKNVFPIRPVLLVLIK